MVGVMLAAPSVGGFWFRFLKALVSSYFSSLYFFFPLILVWGKGRIIRGP